MIGTMLTFGCAVTSVVGEAQACILVESIREYAGRHSDAVIWVFVPRGIHQLSRQGKEAFDRLGASPIEFEIDPAFQGIPFASKVAAAAQAESMITADDQQLAWLDPDTIFFQEPEELLLQSGKVLGCRPVDHLLIGSPAAEPVDAFWLGVYRICEVDPGRLFTMATSADQIQIRPYLNAGCLVVRPEIGLLRRWRACFSQALASAVFEPYFEQDILYRIFLHQAILAGAILSKAREVQIHILPHLVNYPMHMHAQYPADRRPKKMNDLISGRYDTFFRDPAWPDLLPSANPIRDWLAGQLATYDVVE
jgi:hypothetical protein